MKFIQARAATPKERKALMAYTINSICISAGMAGGDLTECKRYCRDWSALTLAVVFDPHPRGFKRKTMLVWWGAEQLYVVYQWRYRKLTAIQQDSDWFDAHFPYAVDERAKTQKLLYASIDAETD